MKKISGFTGGVIANLIALLLIYLTWSFVVWSFVYPIQWIIDIPTYSNDIRAVILMGFITCQPMLFMSAGAAISGSINSRLNK